MNETILNKKIELKPRTPKSDECTCSTCQGIGYVLVDEKYLNQCHNCYGRGVVPKCKYCGEPMTKKENYCIFKCYNEDCIEKEKLETEEKIKQDEINRYNKATKYTFETCPKEYMGMLYSEEYGYNEGYFTDIDELEDWCDGEGIEMLKYVYGTYKRCFTLGDASDFIDDKLEESFEDAYTYIAKSDIIELQKAFDKFDSKYKNTLATYYQNRNVVIEL